MDGVILFADDNIFDSQRIENKLLRKFIETGNFSVLPIENLSILEKTIPSISTYKALILDWNFARSIEDEDISLPDDNPFEFLRTTQLYTLVYIYSQSEISDDVKATLNELYPGRIFFGSKNVDNDVEFEYNKITSGIAQFEADNTHLTVPFIWSRTINRVAQNIFSEFEKADKYWIKELYYSSVRDENKDSGEPTDVEIEPTIEVINLFQNILSERLIQHTELTQAIKKYSLENYKNKPSDISISKLYSKLYYTQTLVTDTVMTGDIYQLQDECYGVIISPECDMNKLIKKNETVELLCFAENDFDNIKHFLTSKDKNRDINRAYNQEIQAVHLLPIFPFGNGSKTALVDFRFSLRIIKGRYLDENRLNRKFKINSPYIQQLRQRYLAYVGRVGVPAIPESLRFSQI